MATTRGSNSRPDLKVLQGHHLHPLFQLDNKLISAFAVKIKFARDLGGDPEYDGDKNASKTTGQESSAVDLHPARVAINNYHDWHCHYGQSIDNIVSMDSIFSIGIIVSNDIMVIRVMSLVSGKD